MPKTATANCQRFGRIAHAVIILCACVARSLRASVDGDPRPRFYLLYINFYLYLHTSICEIILFLVRVLAFGPPLICRPFSFSDFQITVIVLPPLPGLALCLLSWCWLCASSVAALSLRALTTELRRCSYAAAVCCACRLFFIFFLALCYSLFCFSWLKAGRRVGEQLCFLLCCVRCFVLFISYHLQEHYKRYS